MLDLLSAEDILFQLVLAASVGVLRDGIRSSIENGRNLKTWFTADHLPI